MIQILYVLTILLIIAGICFFATKVIDWQERRKAAKYKDATAEFVADLYNLQQKWAARGSYDYSKAITWIMDSFSLHPEQAKALTEYGKQLQKHLEENNG